jgi:hypothetical protein
VALPLALFTIVIAGVMITAVFYVGRLEQRMGNNSIASAKAFEAAETGVTSVLAGWVPATYNSLGNGDSALVPTTSVGGNAVYTALVRRVNTTMFLVQGEGRFLVGGLPVTRRQVARLVRFDPPNLNPQAAVASRLTLTVSGSVQVDGHDSIPTTWGGVCPPPGSTVPGIRDSAPAITLISPCDVPGTCVKGNPNVRTSDSVVSSAGFHTWGNLTFDEMAGMADFTISGSIGGIGPDSTTGPPATCVMANHLNWGDPLNPNGICGNYFPILYAPGDVELTSGWGQGILLVEGDLRLSGPVTFYGAVMVKGNVITTNGNIIGALTLNNVTGTGTTIDGTATITYSSCVLDRVASGAAPPSALNDRSWIQLY